MTQILNLKNMEGLKNELKNEKMEAKVSLKEEKNLLKSSSFDSFLSK